LRTGKTMGIHRPTRKRRNGRAAFRAVEGAVSTGILAGRTVVAIYEEMRSRIEMSYSQFARYVQKLRKTLDQKSSPIQISGPLHHDCGSAHKGLAASLSRPKQLDQKANDVIRKIDMDRFATRAVDDNDLF
jgi:hypothetical protein